MKKRHLLFYTFCVLFSSAHAQITIGSSLPATSGSLLDLKEYNSLSPGSETTTRGLGLPRVSLADNKNLFPMFDNDGLGGYAGTSKSVEDVNHVGLVIYNLTEITTDEKSRLCKGLHVWDGNKWNPLVPYPNHSTKWIKIGKDDDFTDVRGPGGIETNTYHTSRFAVLDTGDPYSCDPDEQLTFLDAGVWMTENLYTRYTASGQAIPLVSGSLNMSVAQHTYTNTNSDPISWGLSYNWAAATVNTGGTNGKGGSTGSDVEVNEEFVDIARVQGICPDGWHLPSTKEYKLLYEVMAKSKDFTTKVPPVGKSAFSFVLKDDPLTGDDTGGISRSANDGGFAGLLLGWGNGGSGASIATTYWTSSASLNVAGISSAYYGRMQKEVDLPFVRGGTRMSFSPIRCKKDEN